MGVVHMSVKWSSGVIDLRKIIFIVQILVLQYL